MSSIFFFFKDTATTGIYTVLTHSFPTRRSSDLVRRQIVPARKSFQIWMRRSTSSGSLKNRSEEHTSELQSLMRISYAVFCLKKKNNQGIIKSLAIRRIMSAQHIKLIMSLITHYTTSEHN